MLKSVLLLALIGCILAHVASDNDEFAFENFDDDSDEEFIDVEVVTEAATAAPRKLEKTVESVNAKTAAFEDEDGIVEDDNEFFDTEEFEGFDVNEGRELPTDKQNEPKLTVAKIPMHFRTHWDSYWMEMLMLAGLLAYFAVFFAGKAKNARLAQLWFNTHRQLLEDNFVLVGDDGKMENENPGLIKESESFYALWCSGRTCCEGMLVELKMIKRQDLVALTAGLLRPQRDQVHIKVELSRGVMDSFVFAVGTKKTITKFFKEYTDLSKYCKLCSDDRYNVPAGFNVLSEIPEATSAILETRIITALNKYQSNIDYIYISDQFSGPIQQDDTSSSLKRPETKPMLMVGFNLPQNGNMELTKPLTVLIFYLMERLKVYRMSREGKAKAEKNRLRVEEEFLKSTSAARADLARSKREEKKREEKERVMADDDPEKQRRWEIKEQKREAKKKAPKMKRMAVKAL